MLMVADIIHCRCGHQALHRLKDIVWNESGRIFSIRDVPVWYCESHACHEELIPSSVQFSVSFLADEMRKGMLPSDVQFKKRF